MALGTLARAARGGVVCLLALCGCGGGGAQLPVAVVVSPGAADVVVGQTLPFTATVSNASNAAVDWSVEEAAGGAITTHGLYTAPMTAGTYRVRATSVADRTRFQRVPVQVRVRVDVQPVNNIVQVGRTQVFTATVTGSANQAVTWSVNQGAAGGTITTAGFYTAPAAAGTYHVRATSGLDPTRFSEVAVIVQGGSASGVIQ